MLFIYQVASQIIVLFCAWKSFKALESTGTEDDTQWLTFWFLYGIVTCAEPFLDVVVGWIPMYYLAKSVLLGYLGPMGGATMVYKNFVRDLLKKHEAAIDAGVARAEARAREAAARATEAGKDVAAKATSTAQRMAAEQAMKSRTD